jgi:hypothetical protein
MSLNLFQLVKRSEHPIDQGLIGERPEALGGLQLRRVGRQEEQMQPFRKPQAGTCMPACLIEHQGNVFVRPELVLLGEGTQSQP